MCTNMCMYNNGAFLITFYECINFLLQIVCNINSYNDLLIYVHLCSAFKLQELIEVSYKNCIKKSDRDLFRQYTPRMLWGNPCKYFPTTPLSEFQRFA